MKVLITSHLVGEGYDHPVKSIIEIDDAAAIRLIEADVAVPYVDLTEEPLAADEASAINVADGAPDSIRKATKKLSEETR